MSNNSQRFNFVNYYPQNYQMQNDFLPNHLDHYTPTQNIQPVTNENAIEIDELIDEPMDETTVDIIDEPGDDETIDESGFDSSNYNSTELWSHSEINKLLDILTVNWELFKTNKTRFYASAAMKLGRNKTGKQVKGKLFHLKTKYTSEKKDVTGKEPSTWPYLNKMDILFGSRENINPDYLISTLTLNEKEKDDVNILFIYLYINMIYKLLIII